MDFIYWGVWKIFPQMKIKEISILLFILSASALVPFCFILIYSRSGVLFSFLTFYAALSTCSIMAAYAPTEKYFLMLPGLLFLISLLYILLTIKLHPILLGLISFVFLGPVFFMLLNVRTSYGLVFIIVLVYTITFLLFKRKFFYNSFKNFAFRVLTLLSFASLGFIILHCNLISPIYADPNFTTEATASHHPLAHPLVLGLAVPKNDLATREGIAWNDSIGLELVQKVRSEPVVYGSHEYELALLDYYMQLWRNNTLEMFQLYVTKFMHTTESTAQMILCQHPSLLRTIAKPFIKIPKKTMTYFPLLMLGAIGCFLYFGKQFSQNFILISGQLFIAAIAVFSESGIILSDIYLTTNFPNTFFMLFFVLITLNIAASYLSVCFYGKFTQKTTANKY